MGQQHRVHGAVYNTLGLNLIKEKEFDCVSIAIVFIMRHQAVLAIGLLLLVASACAGTAVSRSIVQIISLLIINELLRYKHIYPATRAVLFCLSPFAPLEL